MLDPDQGRRLDLEYPIQRKSFAVAGSGGSECRQTSNTASLCILHSRSSPGPPAGRRVEKEPGYVQTDSQNSIAGAVFGYSNDKFLRRCHDFGQAVLAKRGQAERA